MFYELASNKYLLAELSPRDKYKALRQLTSEHIVTNKWSLIMAASLLFILILLLIYKNYITENKD